MAKAREEHRPGPGWFTTDELLVFFGFDSTYFERDLKRLAQGEDEIRKINGANWFYSPTLIRKWKEKERLRGRKKSGNHTDGEDENSDDETLTEEQQYHKTRKLKADADSAEYRAAAEQRKLVLVDIVRPFHSRLAQLIRECGEKNQRQFGPEAYEPFAELIENLQNLNNEFFQDNEPVEADDQTRD